MSVSTIDTLSYGTTSWLRKYLDNLKAEAEKFVWSGFVVFLEVVTQATIANKLHHEQHCVLCLGQTNITPSTLTHVSRLVKQSKANMALYSTLPVRLTDLPFPVGQRYYYYYHHHHHHHYYYYYKCHGLECCHHTVVWAIYKKALISASQSLQPDISEHCKTTDMGWCIT